MDLSNVIIVPKVSTYEIDMNRYRLTHDELLTKYQEEGVNPEKIISSHERHKRSITELKNFFGESQFVSRDYLTRELAAKSDLVIALGGDDHFQYVSHFVDDTPIMGVNSDPLSSEGALNYFTTENFEKVVARLKQGDFKTEEWTRLEAKLNGVSVGKATCHYFLGVSDNEEMAHYLLRFKGKSEEQKSSGLLVATGAGSTGWYDSAGRYLHPNGNKFPRGQRTAEFLAREAHMGKLTGYSMLEGVLKEGDELEVISLNKNSGRLGIDSLEKYDFPRGAKAVIRISNKPLKVVSRFD